VQTLGSVYVSEMRAELRPRSPARLVGERRESPAGEASVVELVETMYCIETIDMIELVYWTPTQGGEHRDEREKETARL
jgi:hypothetical protein